MEDIREKNPAGDDAVCGGVGAVEKSSLAVVVHWSLSLSVLLGRVGEVEDAGGGESVLG